MGWGGVLGGVAVAGRGGVLGERCPGGGGVLVNGGMEIEVEMGVCGFFGRRLWNTL